MNRKYFNQSGFKVKALRVGKGFAVLAVMDDIILS
jgi:hypothetical protein